MLTSVRVQISSPAPGGSGMPCLAGAFVCRQQLGIITGAPDLTDPFPLSPPSPLLTPPPPPPATAAPHPTAPQLQPGPHRLRLPGLPQGEAGRGQGGEGARGVGRAVEGEDYEHQTRTALQAAGTLVFTTSTEGKDRKGRGGEVSTDEAQDRTMPAGRDGGL